MKTWFLVVLSIITTERAQTDEDVKVGPAGEGAYVVPTQQTIRAAGQSVQWHGRPVDIVVSADGRWVYIKDGGAVLTVDAASWKIEQETRLPDKGDGSMHGLALSRDGEKLYVTTAQSRLVEAAVAGDGTLKWGRQIAIPFIGTKDTSYPCGVALSHDGNRAWVCQSMGNALAQVDLRAGKQISVASVGIAPYEVVLSPDEKLAYVSNWGGRRPHSGDKTMKSAGTETVVDQRGIASTGTVSVVDLNTDKVIGEIAVGLHPGAMVLAADGRLFVANANSDSVSVIDTAQRKVIETINVKPDRMLAFGSEPNALALGADEKTLYVADGGNNAVAVIALGELHDASVVRGFVPAGWWPGAVATDGKSLFVANVKGVGSRDPSAAGKWSSHSYWGTATKVAIPDDVTLKKYTQQVNADAQTPQALRAWEKAQAGISPKPVPAHVGEPSVFEHVVYIIKENRSYDQVLGDIGKGNSDPKLCNFGKEVTPNHHALADQFSLLDNYYCNGVLSVDGHAWATQGIAVDYLEKSFGGWARSYPFWGNDPLASASSGFVWDDALLHGASFRNYGEFSTALVKPEGKGVAVYKDYFAKGGKYSYTANMPLEPLRQYSCLDSPGWNLQIPDQARADVFIRELKNFESRGNWPNLILLYLPNDHTRGTVPGASTPAAMVADNDLAVGRVVEAISHSAFWPKTCIFVIEDDPQAGFDHVDGHRSLCLVASPYTKRKQVISHFYNQTSVLHTMELILGLPPMTQMDSMAPAMADCFVETPDLTPYTALKNRVPLDQVNAARADIRGNQLKMAEACQRQNFDVPDAADETMNRAVWGAQMGWDAPYPAALAGAHGKGLRALHLKLDNGVKEDDDD